MAISGRDGGSGSGRDTGLDLWSRSEAAPLARAVVSVLGSWLRDHPQDFRDPPAHSDLGSVRVFLGWAAPGGAEARKAEKLLEDFLEEAQGDQEEEQPVVWPGEGCGALGAFWKAFSM